MTFSAIVTGIFAIAKAVPKIAEFIDFLNERWIDLKVQKIKDTHQDIHKKRKVLLEAIKKAQSDEERITLSVVLNDINSK